MAEKRKRAELKVQDQPSLGIKPVEMRNKDNVQVRVMPSAFERVWRNRGWTLVDAESNVKAAPPAQEEKDR